MEISKFFELCSRDPVLAKSKHIINFKDLVYDTNTNKLSVENLQGFALSSANRTRGHVESASFTNSHVPTVHKGQ